MTRFLQTGYIAQGHCPGHGLFRRISATPEREACCPNCPVLVGKFPLEPLGTIITSRELPYVEMTGQMMTDLSQHECSLPNSKPDAKKRAASIERRKVRKASA